MSSTQETVPVIDVATAIVADCLPLIDADAGFVARVGDDGRTLDVLRVTPYSKNAVHLSFPLDSPYPIAQTMRTRQPLFIASNEQLVCDHPGLVRVKVEDHACATLPLVAGDGEMLGAINFGFEDPHEFTQDERVAFELIGRSCSEAMSLAQRLRTDLERLPRGD